MTSLLPARRTQPRTRRRCWTPTRRPPGGGRIGAVVNVSAGRGSALAGFTLLELLLVLVVLMLLMSTAVLHLDALRRGAELREGVARLESLLRFGRAEAALRGQRLHATFQLAPESEFFSAPETVTNLVQLTVESDPLNQPGRFRPLPATGWAIRRPGELIWIEDARLTEGAVSVDSGTDAASRIDFSGGASSGELATGRTFQLTFDPEGGTQSAEFLVRSTDPTDPRAMLVKVNGFGGRVSHRLLDEEALDAWRNEEATASADAGTTDSSATAAGRGAR